MKNTLLNKVLPHVIAVLCFLIISVLFCKPALEGNVLDQHDINGWKGIAQNAFDYKEKHGEFPLWNTNVFSGMPNYLIAMNGSSILPDITAILTLGLPQPISFFFLACICFYVLCMALGARPVVGILGSLAYALATYNPIIIAAGHVTKMHAIAYMPLVLAGLVLLYTRKYWLGLAVSTLGFYSLIVSNHPQITFYTLLVAGAVTIGYLVHWIMSKQFKHAGIALGLAAVTAIVALMANSLSFLVTSEYSKATIRGGKTVNVEGDKVTATKSSGLDTAYAFQYSLGKAEVATVIMPNAFGGDTRRKLDAESSVTDKLVEKNIPESSAAQVSESLMTFWGDPGSTAGGPLYSGAIICILALIGFVLYKGPLRWALLAVAILAVMMAWGKHLMGFNLFLFENMPLYNKFRAPSITMVIVQLVLPVMAVLATQYLFFRDNSQELLKNDFKKILYTCGGLFAVLGMLYIALDYNAVFDPQIVASYTQDGNDEFGRLIVAGLKEERKAEFAGQLFRTLGFIILVLALLWLYMKKVLPRLAVVIILIVVTLIDQWMVDKKYLNDDNYKSKDELITQTATRSDIDNQILKDTSPHYRVYNAGQVRFSAEDFKVSTYHKAVGGYHPAKLRIYQDVIERYFLSGVDPQQVLNMLNVKYVIFENPQNGQQSLMVNDQAYGPCWLVKGIRQVNSDADELQAIGVTNLRDTAVIQKAVAQPQWDSTASLSLAKHDNDAIEYNFQASSPQFAVFSEIYYPYGWNAYIDGNKVEHSRVNYILRGMSIPAGKHSIRFVFEPATYKKGASLSFIGSILVALLILGGLFMHWRESRRDKVL